MLSCSDIRENICAYIDKELNKSERISFEEHIKDCISCRKELDEMSRIVALCTDLPQQELPADFNMELHEKLLAVAGRQEINVRKLDKSKGFRFIKTFAPIAAALFLIFLAGNYFKPGFFSSMKASEKSNNAVMSAEKAADGMAAESASEALKSKVTADSVESPENDSETIVSFGVSQAVNESSADRSSDSNRKYAYTQDSRQGLETASNKISTITITSDDPAAQIEIIKKLAADNSVDIPVDADQNGTAGLSVTAAEEPAAEEPAAGQTATGEATKARSTGLKVEDNTRQQLDFIIPDSNYDQFVASLTKTFGTTNVQAGAFVTEDLTELLTSSIKRSDELDQRILELQNEDSKKNASQIQDLKTEKDKVDSLIEEIRLGTDFVNVTIYIDNM